MSLRVVVTITARIYTLMCLVVVEEVYEVALFDAILKECWINKKSPGLSRGDFLFLFYLIHLNQRLTDIN